MFCLLLPSMSECIGDARAKAKLPNLLSNPSFDVLVTGSSKLDADDFKHFHSSPDIICGFHAY